MSDRVRLKTNALRLLEAQAVPYEAYTYGEQLVTAQAVAEDLGVPEGQVFKTLVLLADGKPILVMVGGDHEVVPRVLASALGARAVRLAPKPEAERLTGLRTGGIGALALTHKHFPVFIDESALGYERVYVNGGRRGLNVLLRTDDLLRLTGARTVPVR